MVDAGVPIQFSDIVAYTAKGVSTEIINTLSNNFSGNTNQTFFYGDQIHTLVSLAVNKKIIDSVAFWLSESVNPSPLKYRTNAIDYVTTYTNREQLEEVVSLLIDYEVIPNKPSTYDFLNKNLSNAYQQKNKKQLDLFNYENLTLEETKLNNDTVNKLFTIATRDLIMEEECPISIKSKQILVRKIFSFTDNSKNRKAITVARETEVFDKYNELENINKHLSTSKNVPEIKKVPKSPKEQEKVDRQIKLIRDGHWKKYLAEQLEEVELSDKEIIDFSFVLALMGGANSEELIELIEKGTEVPPNLVRLIVNKCKLDVLESLYATGYNFHHVYPDGSNAVSSAVLHKKLESLKFLINIGVNVNGKENPLNTAFRAVEFNPVIYLNIIDTLIFAGAKITDLHKKYVNSFANNNLDLYLTLINKHPKLKP